MQTGISSRKHEENLCIISVSYFSHATITSHSLGQGCVTTLGIKLGGNNLSFHLIFRWINDKFFDKNLSERFDWCRLEFIISKIYYQFDIYEWSFGP